ncbi:CHAT domain-containing protein [Planktothrix agardhii]|uniref:CHAT domain-containing protein n=1 Tax=Planktothrix agardhii TaxID=1160 RepID=UPI0020A80320|nr:CHAT domain-containing protein [Planktothrix agardhii]CAD5945533.1 NB-ARC domain protein (Modular protein) [Planktothrix agardhii]
MEKTYCTYRIRVANRDRIQVEKWDSQHQDRGQPSGAFQYQQKLPEIAPLLQKVRSNELNDSTLARSLGESLFDILFDDVLRQDFVNFYYQVVQQEKQLLRVELDIDEQGMPEIAALPWEFMCVPARANLGTIWMGTVPDLVFSRRRSQWIAAQPIQLESDEKLRIALVIAAPPNLPSVAYEPVQAALEKLAFEQANRVELLPVVRSANPEAIDTILSKNPHIFHFIGHGRMQTEGQQEVGEMALVDPDFDEAMWVEANYFSELFNQHRPGVVMLQACEGGMLSSSQAFVGVASKVVQQNVPVVVAMQYEVTNSTASRFALRFYQQLAANDPVDIAAQYGRRAIALGSTQYRKRDFATPVIFMRVQNGYLFQRQAEAKSSTLNDHSTIKDSAWNIQIVNQQGSKYNINLGPGSTVHQNDDMTRQEDTRQENSQSSLPKTILVLASNPKNQSSLRLDEEMREINEGLRRSQQREKFIVQQRWAVRPEDLRRALLDLNPHILHFCGHGSGEDGLVLEDDTGKAQLVPTEALANLFKRFATRGLECVVFNACYSELQAKAIAEHIDYVVGMSSAIGDKAAIQFAVGFYDELGAGWSYEDAYHGGCDAIALQGIPEEHTPVFKNTKKSSIEGNKSE